MHTLSFYPINTSSTESMAVWYIHHKHIFVLLVQWKMQKSLANKVGKELLNQPICLSASQGEIIEFIFTVKMLI